MEIPLQRLVRSKGFGSCPVFPATCCISETTKQISGQYWNGSDPYQRVSNMFQTICTDFIIGEIQDLQSAVPFEHLGQIRNAGLNGGANQLTGV
jgi:hypothetical protein